MIAVIGCGNPNRCDDGAGPAVIEALRARGLEQPGVRLFDAGTDGMSVIYAARGCRTLIIVDAASSGSPPGAVFELPGSAINREPQRSFSLHDFRWDHAVFAGRRTYGDQFPTDVVVLLIEAASVALGLGLSAAVSTAVARVADRVDELVSARLAGRPPELAS
jgi:hydrogenase maturation protease